MTEAAKICMINVFCGVNLRDLPLQHFLMKVIFIAIKLK